MKTVYILLATMSLCLSSVALWAGEAAAPVAGAASEEPPVSIVGEVKPRAELQTLEGVRVWVVNGTEIPMTQVEKMAGVYHGPYVLQDLVANLLLEQEAARMKITLTEQEVQDTENDLRQQLGARSDVAFQSYLRTQNATPQWFHDKARAYALVKKVLANNVRVTDREVEAYYNSNQQLYRVGETIGFRMMGFQDKAAAEAALAEVRKDKSFQEVAKATAPDARSRATAGELEYYQQGQQNLPPEFAIALSASPLNQVTGPVKLGSWFYLIKVEQRVDAHQFTLTEEVDQGDRKATLREVIRQQISQQRLEQKVWPEWIQAQLKSAKIEVVRAK